MGPNELDDMGALEGVNNQDRPVMGADPNDSSDQLLATEAADSAARDARGSDQTDEGDETGERAVESLASYINSQWMLFRNHNEYINIRDRCLAALRAYSGKYNAVKTRQIREFGGSDVYARITSVKCRGATALLRDVFLGAQRTWGIDATPVPSMPDDIIEEIDKLIGQEMQQLAAAGQPITPDMLDERKSQLMAAANSANIKKARVEAKKAEQKLDDLLVEGKFYESLIEFITDLPIMPFACIKGPVVKRVHDLKWENGKMVSKEFPRMFWNRVSPMDLYWTPGAVNLEDAAVIEHIKIARKDLNTLIGLPGYNEEEIRECIRDYESGYHDPLLDDATRADLEGRETPGYNVSELMDALEWHGPIIGRRLLDYGFTEAQVPDKDKDYHVTAWIIGKYTIKVQINPNANKRHPYFMTSFEKVPGSVVGSCIPEIIEDVQDIANAAMRSLVNNLSISSGPQVMINEELLSPTTDPDSLFPWKRWRYIGDPAAASNSIKPVDFFQPNSNAQELLGVFKEMSMLADEVSAIPRYMSGSDNAAGAARTASGLSMLLNNASKMLKTVASNIDRDIMNPVLQSLYTKIILVDKTGMFRGDEKIRVRGVEVATQMEQERMRKLEFLQMTANPVDLDIIGKKGRAAILRELSGDLGMPPDEVVPTEQEMQQQQAMAMSEPPGGNPNEAAPPSGGGGGGAQAPQITAASNSKGSLTEGHNNGFRTMTPKAISNQVR